MTAISSVTGPLIHLARDTAWTDLLLDALTRLRTERARLNPHTDPSAPTRTNPGHGTGAHPRRHSGHCRPKTHDQPRTPASSQQPQLPTEARKIRSSGQISSLRNREVGNAATAEPPVQHAHLS